MLILGETKLIFKSVARHLIDGIIPRQSSLVNMKLKSRELNKAVRLVSCSRNAIYVQ